MSFLDDNAALTGGLMLAGQLGMNNLRQAAAARHADLNGADWIRYLTHEIKKRDTVIAQLKSDLSVERSGRLQAQSALRGLVRR
jgi:hypothetical protein